MTQPHMDIRGHTSTNQAATYFLRRASILADTFISLLLGALALRTFHVSPVPRPELLGFFISISILYWIPQKFFLGVTLGERLWLLESKTSETSGGKFRLRKPLFQRDYMTPIGVFGSSLATTLTV